jgi:hypothetical protein
MDTSTLELTTREEVATPSLEQQVRIAFYSRRLERLLRIDARAISGLTSAEANRLRSEGVLATIRALTELEAGAVASELLRRAPRRVEPGEQG